MREPPCLAEPLMWAWDAPCAWHLSRAHGWYFVPGRMWDVPRSRRVCPGLVSPAGGWFVGLGPAAAARGRPCLTETRRPAWNRPGDLDPVLSCSILPSRARSCRASDGGCLHHFTALQSPKGAVGLSMVQLDLGSCSFQHFVRLDDVCVALKRSAKSWST